MDGIWHCGPDAVGTLKAGVLVYARPVNGQQAAITKAMVAASFHKCCASNAPDSTKDSEISEGTSDKEDPDTTPSEDKSFYVCVSSPSE